MYFKLAVLVGFLFLRAVHRAFPDASHLWGKKFEPIKQKPPEQIEPEVRKYVFLEDGLTILVVGLTCSSDRSLLSDD